MHPTGERALEFALELLRWSLDQPLVYGERQWGDRVARALDRVRDAFDRHAHLVEGPDGPLAHVADPSQLPFTPEARQAQSLRRQRQALRVRMELVAAQIRGALLLFAGPFADAPASAGGPLPEAQAYRMFDTLGSCVADLLSAVEAHLSEEVALQGSSSATWNTGGGARFPVHK
jgi:hypothetical protein